MISLKVQGQVICGSFVSDESTLLMQWLEKHEGERLEVVFRKPSKDKTLQQLGYLHGHVIPQIAEYTGYSEEEVYGILKYKFLRYHIAPDDDGYRRGMFVQEGIHSLSEMNREQVAKFIQDCIDWGTSLGCDIYPPNNFGG